MKSVKWITIIGKIYVNIRVFWHATCIISWCFIRIYVICIYSMLYAMWRSCNTSSVGQWLADFSFCLYTTRICASSQYYLASLLPVTRSLSREYVVFFRMCIIVSLKIQYKFNNSFLFFNFETLHFFLKEWIYR